MFCVCLFFAIFVPLMMPLACILFWISYAYDKYNLIYLAEFQCETQTLNRQTLIIYTLIGIFLFQFSFIYTVSTLLTRRVTIILGVFFVIEIILLIIALEVFRKPWKGKKSKKEQFEEEVRWFEDDDKGYGDENDDELVDPTLTRHRSINETRKKKTEWLEKAYKDPYGLLFATIQVKEI